MSRLKAATRSVTFLALAATGLACRGQPVLGQGPAGSAPEPSAPLSAVTVSPPAALPSGGAWRPERIGAVPGRRVLVDLTVPGRVHTAGSVSDDGGRTWRRRIGLDQRAIRPVGGSRERAFALGPHGRVLCAEVLFESPSDPPGLSPLVHVVEWTGTLWEIRMPGDPSQAGGLPEPPVLPVRAVGYLPTGEPFLVTDHEVHAGARVCETPGPVVGFVAAEDGALYAAVDRIPFSFYWAEAFAASWRPLGGIGRVTAVAQGADGEVYVAGERLGRGRRADWRWTSWPRAVRPTHLAAHPQGKLIVAWSRDGLAVSRDGGLSITVVPLPAGTSVECVALDPRAEDDFLLVDGDGSLFRLNYDGSL